jgi:hypothetical protein
MIAYLLIGGIVLAAIYLLAQFQKTLNDDNDD